MNYDLAAKIVPNYEDLGIGRTYGEPPSALLQARFEETDMGNDEYLYDDYARRTLTDWGPDKTLFEHEEPWNNKNMAIIDLRYNGHRGKEEVYKPEMFYGIMDKDPRGINVEPDLKQARTQHEARTRYHKFTPNGPLQITSGNRAETRIIEDKQKANTWAKKRFKIFSRQLEVKRLGAHNPIKAHKSLKCDQVCVPKYGEDMPDLAKVYLNNNTIASEKLVRDAQSYRATTADEEFAVGHYSMERRAKRFAKFNPMAMAAGSIDSDMDDHKSSIQYKAVGILMSKIVKQRREARLDGDLPDADRGTPAAKSAKVYQDLAAALREISQDAEFSASHTTISMKNTTPSLAEHTARLVQQTHLTPAHHYLAAEIMYKNIVPRGDYRGLLDETVTDQASPEIVDITAKAAKTAKMRLKTGRKLDVDGDGDYGESAETINYRTVLQRDPKHMGDLVQTDAEFYASDLTQARKEAHKKHRVVDKEDFRLDGRFGDNHAKDRRIRGIGSKYMVRHIRTETPIEERFSR